MYDASIGPPRCVQNSGAAIRRRDLGPPRQPFLQRIDRALIETDYASLASLATLHDQPALDEVDVLLSKRERLADPESRPPQHDDQGAIPHACPRRERTLLDDRLDLRSREEIGFEADGGEHESADATPTREPEARAHAAACVGPVRVRRIL